MRFDEISLAQVLQDEVDGFPREADEIRDIALAEPKRNDDALCVRDAVMPGEIEQRMGHPCVRTLVEELLETVTIGLEPPAHELGDLVLR